MSDDSAVNYLTPEQIRGKRIREGRPMTDTLRDRIAYAIAQADGDLPGMEPASCDYELADAVIAELGLTRESPQLCDGGTHRHRYVTDWADDDE